MQPTLLVSIFAVFDKVRDKFVPAKNVILENSAIFMQVWELLQHFDGESAKIYTHEIRSFLSSRK